MREVGGIGVFLRHITNNGSTATRTVLASALSKLATDPASAQDIGNRGGTCFLVIPMSFLCFQASEGLK